MVCDYLDVAVADMRARNVNPRHSRAKLLMVRADAAVYHCWRVLQWLLVL